MTIQGYRGEFLKGYDRYAKAVSLTYMKSWAYVTPAGGVFSICGFILIFYWVCV